jgi:cytochrome c-type biogenesis protein CcsB
MNIVAVLLLAALASLLGAVLIAALEVAARIATAAPATVAGTAAPPAGERIGRSGSQFALAFGAACRVAALGLRAVQIGHAPWSNLYEFSQAFAAGILLAYLALARRLPIRSLAPWVALLAAGLLAVALTLPQEAKPLVPALQAPLLLSVHVGAAVVAYAVSGVAFVAALGELIQLRAGDRFAALPAAAVCRTAAHRSVLVAFPVLTLAILLGSVWANLAWRSYWNNDPKELAAAATWLVYAAYLHVAGRRDRLGALAPWLLVLGFVAVAFTYLGAGLLFVGQHSYATS